MQLATSREKKTLKSNSKKIVVIRIHENGDDKKEDNKESITTM